MSKSESGGGAAEQELASMKAENEKLQAQTIALRGEIADLRNYIDRRGPPKLQEEKRYVQPGDEATQSTTALVAYDREHMRLDGRGVAISEMYSDNHVERIARLAYKAEIEPYVDDDLDFDAAWRRLLPGGRERIRRMTIAVLIAADAGGGARA